MGKQGLALKNGREMLYELCPPRKELGFKEPPNGVPNSILGSISGLGYCLGSHSVLDFQDPCLFRFCFSSRAFLGS
ncbi:hypothetical protein [Pasteuria penetrans]|uniref:hypothetical protein n=1 Tax=Pasteuria penetrans TaxID=86005 RepID=UPI000FB11446|nr:hypothetical protein [Pasteuria penetrans]